MARIRMAMKLKNNKNLKKYLMMMTKSSTKTRTLKITRRKVSPRVPSLKRRRNDTDWLF